MCQFNKCLYKYVDGVTYGTENTGAPVQQTGLSSFHSDFSQRLHDDSLSLQKKNLFIQYNLNLLDLYLIKMMCDYTNPAHFLTDEPRII